MQLANNAASLSSFAKCIDLGNLGSIIALQCTLDLDFDQVLQQAMAIPDVTSSTLPQAQASSCHYHRYHASRAACAQRAMVLPDGACECGQACAHPGCKSSLAIWLPPVSAEMRLGKEQPHFALPDSDSFSLAAAVRRSHCNVRPLHLRFKLHFDLG